VLGYIWQILERTCQDDHHLWEERVLQAARTSTVGADYNNINLVTWVKRFLKVLAAFEHE
jgi:hypothetical protein